MRLIRGGADIQIRFKRGGDVLQYQPGDMLEADIEVRSENTITCRDIVVAVGWHTEGKGDRNSGRSYVDPLGVTEIVPGIPITHQFSCRLPNTPYSYEGELIRIVWALTVKVDIAMMPDMTESRPFILQP